MAGEADVGLEVRGYAGGWRHRELHGAGNKLSMANLVRRLSISSHHPRRATLQIG
jgi:hypothetical protein